MSKDQDRIIISGMVILMLFLWLGFLLHRSSGFAGSSWGLGLGISGAILMLVPLFYSIIKRNKRIKKRVTQWITMPKMLTIHTYAGVFGPILALLHTGHKFNSPLGIVLTALMLAVALSGFIGRYLIRQISREIGEKRDMLIQLNTFYDQMANENVPLTQYFPAFSQATEGLLKTSKFQDIIQVADSIAELEYAVKMHEVFKLWFGRWLGFHIIISFTLYILLVLHIWAALHFGLRWFT